MRRMLFSLLTAGLATSAAGQTAPVPDWLRALPRSDYGCEVLLCLADPRGPRTESQCVPPINRLMRDLARGRAFPTCNMATGPNGRSYASPTSRYYDACPAGTKELPVGQVAELAAPVSAAPTTKSGAPSPYAPAASDLSYSGIGDGSGYGYSSPDNPAPVKVCVAGFRGSRTYSSGDSSYDVGLYDTIYMQRAAPSAFAVDVFVDDRLWQTVRW